MGFADLIAALVALYLALGAAFALVVVWSGLFTIGVTRPHEARRVVTDTRTRLAITVLIAVHWPRVVWEGQLRRKIRK